MTDRQTQMQTDLESVNYELERARADAEVANARVSSLEKEARALQAAIDILEGKEPVAPVISLPNVIAGSGMQEFVERALAKSIGTREVVKVNEAAPTPSVPGAVKLGDEWIVLESGMKIGKNVYGEDVIVPEGTPDPQAFMPPPTKPVGHSIPTLPVLPGEGFSNDPNDILF